jgi:hypothetical protein
MSFSFNFQFDAASKEEACSGSREAFELSSADSTRCSHRVLRPESFDNECLGGFTVVSHGGVDFKKIIANGSETIPEDVDIIPRVYEGGFKLWEGSLDLVEFMLTNRSILPATGNGRVIELGCGHGFPGIAAISMGYRSVSFSDFNEDVVIRVTWPNIVLNCSEHDMQDVNCFYGDWMDLSNELR